MRSARLTAVVVLGAALSLLVIKEYRVSGEVDLLLLAMVSAGFAVLDALPLTLARGSSLRTDAGVATAAIVLLTPEIAAISLAIGAGLSLLLTQPGDTPRMPAIDISRRILTVFAVASVFQVSSSLAGVSDKNLEILVFGGLCGILYSLVDMLGFLYIEGCASGSSISDALAGLIRLLGALYLSQVSVGIVMAITYSGLGVMVVPILALLMVLMQHSFGLLLGIRSAYMRTISALARLSELQFAGREGHAERVASLAALVGRKMGLSSRQMERVSLAALLHDVGRLGLNVPADESDATGTQRLIAQRGADIVAQVDFLSDLAPVVRLQAAQPEMSPAIETDELLMAQIIRAASNYDDLMLQGVPETDRLARMRSGKGGAHSMRVLHALEQALSGRSRP